VVEAVNLDMIRRNLARLETIREVSLQDVSSVDDASAIRNTCPSVYVLISTNIERFINVIVILGLDLSGSLLSDWTSVEQLCSALCHLERLYLK
jgi:hypothetical protein